MHPYRGWPFLSDPHHPALSAVWAVFAHGILSLFVVLPIVLRSNRRVLFGTLAFIGGPALDLDHAVAAGSCSPRRWRSWRLPSHDASWRRGPCSQWSSPTCSSTPPAAASAGCSH
jgi:hypothetical protein